MKYSVSWLASLLLFVCVPASANITVVSVSGCGSHTSTINWNVADQAWEVSFNATITCNGPYTVNVRADLPLDSIKYINISQHVGFLERAGHNRR